MSKYMVSIILLFPLMSWLEAAPPVPVIKTTVEEGQEIVPGDRSEDTNSTSAARVAPEESESYRPAASFFLGDAQGASIMPELNWNTGVYCIRNVVNGKRYVGSSAKNLVQRIRSHKKSLNQQTHRNRHLQRAWDKCGSKKFRFSILERCPPSSCLEREQYWIDFYESADPSCGYNICPVAGSVLGLQHTDEARAKKSLQTKKHMESQEARSVVSEGLKKYYIEHPESLVAMAERSRKYHEENPEIGSEHSARMLAFYTEHPEYREQHSKRMKKYYSTPEARAAASARAKKQFESLEGRLAQSVAQKKRFESREARDTQSKRVKELLADPITKARWILRRRLTLASKCLVVLN